MLIILMTVCSLAAPYDCTDRKLQFVDAETPAFCMITTMPHLVAWVDEHPGFRVATWRCDYATAEGAPA